VRGMVYGGAHQGSRGPRGDHRYSRGGRSGGRSVLKTGTFGAHLVCCWVADGPVTLAFQGLGAGPRS
jgi:D-Tyr-tRNAtyr deacylase